MKKIISIFILSVFGIGLAYATTPVRNAYINPQIIQVCQPNDPNSACSTVNWSSMPLIQSSGVNWPDINRYKTITTAINWQALPQIVQTYNINWNDINRIGNMNSTGMNWNNINGLNPINQGGVNWNNIPSYATGSVLTATTNNGVNWSNTLSFGNLPATSTYRHITFMCSNGGSALLTGICYSSPALDFGGTVVSTYLTSSDGTTGSISVDLWRSNAAIPTTSAASMIGAGTKPSISAGTYAQKTTFGDWTSTTINKNDVLILNIFSTSSIKFLTITVVIQQTS